MCAALRGGCSGSFPRAYADPGTAPRPQQVPASLPDPAGAEAAAHPPHVVPSAAAVPPPRAGALLPHLHKEAAHFPAPAAANAAAPRQTAEEELRSAARAGQGLPPCAPRPASRHAARQNLPQAAGAQYAPATPATDAAGSVAAMPSPARATYYAKRLPHLPSLPAAGSAAARPPASAQDADGAPGRKHAVQP